MSTVVGRLHDVLVFPRRVRVLAERLAPHFPEGARVLDFGCGDGLVAARVAALRPDLSMRGVDVLARPRAHIPVDLFDGGTLPYSDGEFDAVMIVDVLHHAEDPASVLREARRVCRGVVVLKDHLCDPWLGRPRLRLMDFVGNAHHGVALTYNYWSRARWRAAFREIGLTEEWWSERLGLYPAAAAWLFEDSLHFLGRLRVAG
jgi:SAM-dependent methyltransferase